MNNKSLKLTWELAKIQDGQGHPGGHSYSEIVSRQLSSKPLDVLGLKMKFCKLVLLCLGVLIVINSCSSEPGDQDEIPPSPTIEITKTPIEYPTEIHVTHTPDVTLTPSPSPTESIRLEPPASSYELATLDVYDGIDLVQLSDDQLNSLPSEIRYMERYAVDAFIEFELNRSFSNGIKVDEDVFNYLIEELKETNRYEPGFIFQYLALGFTDYLNHHKIQLKANENLDNPDYSVAVYRVEINADPTSEWLLQLKTNRFGNTIWFTLDQKADHSYHLLKTEIESGDWSFYFHDEPLILDDITGDGLTDIIVVNDDADPIAKNLWVRIHVAKGSPEGFHLMSTIEAQWYEKLIDTISYDLLYGPGGSVEGLRLTIENYKGWGCITTTTELYKWHDGIESSSSQGEQWPDTASCAIFQAVKDQYWGENKSAASRFEYALRLNMEEQVLSIEEMIFVHYRLAQIYSMEKNNQAASNHISAIMQYADVGDSRLAVNLGEKLKPLLQTHRITPLLLCDVSNSLSAYTPYMFNYEGYEEGFPDQLCNRSNFSQIVEGLEFDDIGSLDYLIREEGFRLNFKQSLDLGNSEIDAVIVAVEPDDFSISSWPIDYPSLAVWKFTKGEGFRSVAWFGRASGSPITWYEDFSGDLVPEFFLAVRSDSRGSCEDDYSPWGLFIATVMREGLVLYDQKHICWPVEKEFDLEIFLSELEVPLVEYIIEERITMSDLPHNLALLNMKEPPETWMSAYDLIDFYNASGLIKELDNEFFNGTEHSQYIDKLFKIRDLFDPSNLEGAYIRSHINYLLALSYEDAGEDQKAVQTFFDLANSEKTTLWSRLAKSRLTKTE